MRKNKLGIAPLVITSLLLLTALVSAITLNSWYSSFTSSLETKKFYEQKLNSNELDIFKFVNDSNSFLLYIRKYNSNYIIIDNISINGNNCIMPSYNNIIVGSGISIFELSCSNVNVKNDITLFSKSGIYTQKVLLE